MAYIGRQPISGQFEKQQLTADGSTTSFALNWSVGSTSALIVSVGGVLQEPETAYTLSGGGTNIVFTAAPASGDRVYVHFLGQAIVQNLTDVNGVELILDADADTSITADTDDTIDIKVAGADDFQITANTLSVLTGSNVSLADSSNIKVGTGNDMLLYHDGSNSYITNAVGALKIETETSGIALTIGHTTSETTIADNLTVTGTTTLATGGTNITGLDIDGGTDIGAAIVDADLFIVDDGAGGTNRKVTASRLKTYAQSGLTSDSITDANSNTKIQVEESSDDDTIRFDVSGVETSIMTAKGLELGAAGGFFLNQTTNTQTVTIAAAENAMMVGPVAFSGTVTVAGVLAII